MLLSFKLNWCPEGCRVIQFEKSVLGEWGRMFL